MPIEIKPDAQYLQETGMPQIIDGCVVHLTTTQPDRPARAILQYLEKAAGEARPHARRQRKQEAAAARRGGKPAGSQMKPAAAPTKDALTYLVEKKVPEMIDGALRALLKKQPVRPVRFLVAYFKDVNKADNVEAEKIRNPAILRGGMRPRPAGAKPINEDTMAGAVDMFGDDEE